MENTPHGAIQSGLVYNILIWVKIKTYISISHASIINKLFYVILVLTNQNG